MMEPVLRDFYKHCDIQGIEPRVEVLAEFLTTQGIKIGGIYRHFKGNYYEVTGIRRNCDEWKQYLVDYQEIHNADHKASRELTNFLSNIERDDYKGPRFVLVK